MGFQGLGERNPSTEINILCYIPPRFLGLVSLGLFKMVIHRLIFMNQKLIAGFLVCFVASYQLEYSAKHKIQVKIYRLHAMILSLLLKH